MTACSQLLEIWRQGHICTYVVRNKTLLGGRGIPDRRLPIADELGGPFIHLLLNGCPQARQQATNVVHQNAVQSSGKIGCAALAADFCILLVAVKKGLLCLPGVSHAAIVVDVLLTPVDHT